MPESGARLAPGMRVIVRGWLNANHVVFDDAEQTVMIDSGQGRDADLSLEQLNRRCGAAGSTGWSTPTAIPPTWAAILGSAMPTAAA